MPIKAIVFDFDGVLADSEWAHEQTIARTAQSHGLTLTHRQYETEVIGFDDAGAFNHIQTLNGQTPDPALTDQLAKEKTELFEAMVKSHEVGLYEGAADFARAAADRLPVAICSGAAGNEIRLMLQAAGIADRFVAVISADDVAQSKPDPAGYRLACEALRHAPADCLAIEDTPVGLTAARAAGLRVAGVGTSAPKPALGHLEAFADRLTDFDLNDLIAL